MDIFYFEGLFIVLNVKRCYSIHTHAHTYSMIETHMLHKVFL